MVRVMIGKTVDNIVSINAPQVGRSKEEKEDIYAEFGKVLLRVGSGEKLFVVIWMDMLDRRLMDLMMFMVGHGFDSRNFEGETWLEFADAMGLTVTNTWYEKCESRKVTYVSGGCRSVVDYWLHNGEKLWA